MAKSKYDPLTFPLLAEGYAREGMIDTEIAAKLGISNGAFYKYQKEHVEFLEALKRGKAPVDVQVENALLQSAMGFEYEELKVEKLEDEAQGKNGQTPSAKKSSKQRVTRITKRVVPSVTAQIFWLKNRRPDRWRDTQHIEQNVTDVTEMEKTRALFDSMTQEEREQWLEEHQYL